MTRNYDGDPVLAVRPTYRALRAVTADRAGQGFVGSRLAVRNLQELLPHGSLKRASRVDEWNREVFERPREIPRQLSLELIDMLVRARNDGAGELFPQICELGLQHPPIREFEKANP